MGIGHRRDAVPTNARSGGGTDGLTVVGAGLSHHYAGPSGDVPVLIDASFTVPRDGYAALVGPSGAGKTTLLCLIGGLERVQTGTLEVGGSDVATLEGDLHGGAPGKVMRAILEAGTPDRAEVHVRATLARGERIMGMGHREYKIRDPRAQHLEAMAKALGEATDRTWYDVARALEDAADRVLREEKPGSAIFANVEFYTAPTLYALGIPADEFTCLFACARMAGWTAHILEQLANNRLIRPQAAYTGADVTPWVPLERRTAGNAPRG